MDISAIGSINEYVKAMELKTQWKAKRETGDYAGHEDKPMSEWEKAAKDMEEKTEKDREKVRLHSIYMKMSSGKKLTEEERSYLRDKDPVSYEKSRSIDRERKAYERQLKRCKTKEDVRRLKMSKLSTSLSTVNAVKNDPHITDDMKLKLATMEKSRVAALEDVERKFVRRGDFGRLPANAADAGSDRKIIREFRKTLEDLWEEIFRDTEDADELVIYDKNSVYREPENDGTGEAASPPEKEKSEQAAARAAAEQAYVVERDAEYAGNVGRVISKKA